MTERIETRILVRDQVVSFRADRRGGLETAPPLSYAELDISRSCLGYRCPGPKIVNFHQANSSCLSRPCQDRGIGAWLERREDDRFAIVARLEDGPFDLRLFWAVFPIVVHRDQRAIGAVQLENWVKQDLGGGYA